MSEHDQDVEIGIEFLSLIHMITYATSILY